jgi:hypothetical protein
MQAVAIHNGVCALPILGRIDWCYRAKVQEIHDDLFSDATPSARAMELTMVLVQLANVDLKRTAKLGRTRR